MVSLTHLNPRERRLAIDVFGATVLLCSLALAAWVLASPVTPRPETAPAADADTLPATHQDAHPALTTMERFEPLLVIDLRRPLYDPPPPVKKQVKVQHPPFRGQLVGTIIKGKADNQATAIMTDSNGKTHFLTKNDTIEQATVTKITTDRVTLRYFDQTLTLSNQKQVHSP